MNKKVLIGTALAVVVAATAAGAWWWKKSRGTQAAAGDALVVDPNAPFECKTCQARLHEDRPALAVTFSAPVGPGQSLDQLIAVKDFGEATSTAEGAAKRGATGSVINGSWVVADNPSLTCRLPDRDAAYHHLLLRNREQGAQDPVIFRKRLLRTRLKSASRCRVGGRQPVDPAADDEHVERLRGQTLKIAALHRENI